ATAADPGGSGVGQAFDHLLAEPAQGPVSARFKAIVGSSEIRTQLRLMVAQTAPAQLPAFDQAASGIDLDILTAYKADWGIFAATGGLVAPAALLGGSFFSLAVGVLLIFLIFVMLAAERRAEMGMSRAVGLKRRHLTQMFLFEGLAYTLVASAVGVALGLAVGTVMIQVLSSIFNGFNQGIHLTSHVEWTSLVIAVCLGLLLTFVVVAFSAYRVSRLNIVAAIRDLDESEQRDTSLGKLFVAPFAVA